MSQPKVFHVETAEATLVVLPLQSMGSLAEENVRAELDLLLVQLQKPDLRHVVVDFQHVAYFGTAMLEVLLLLWRRIRDRSGKLAICNASQMEQEVLRISSFDTIWPICRSRKEALESVTA
jgi:anti-anti-sigma factor